MSGFNESTVEEAALYWFGKLGYAIGHGPHLAPGEPAAERDSFAEVVLAGRLREAILRLNPTVPGEAREEALRKVLRVTAAQLVLVNAHPDVVGMLGSKVLTAEQGARMAEIAREISSCA